MPGRYSTQQAENGDWWVIDTSLPGNHPKKIISAHSSKEAAEDTVKYQNELEANRKP